MKKQSPIKGIEGLIIDYHSEIDSGIILLKHKTVHSFSDHIDQYMNDKNSDSYWFASFKLNAFSTNTKQAIYALLKTERDTGSNITINKFLKGKLVLCDVLKDTHWKVVYITIDLHQPNISFSDYRKNKPTGMVFKSHGRKGCRGSQSTVRFENRMDIKNLVRGSNISRPFRG